MSVPMTYRFCLPYTLDAVREAAFMAQNIDSMRSVRELFARTELVAPDDWVFVYRTIAQTAAIPSAYEMVFDAQVTEVALTWHDVTMGQYDTSKQFYEDYLWDVLGAKTKVRAAIVLREER